MAGTTADLNVRTLYDDWQSRRQRLVEAVGGDADYRVVELRLLDYLLRRYRGSPEATRPARFPLPTGLFVNHRAIVVHHHLGRGVIPTITNQQEAQARVRAIVARMQTPPAASKAPGAEQAVASWPCRPRTIPWKRRGSTSATPIRRSVSGRRSNWAKAAVWTTSGCSRTCSPCRSAPTNTRASERPCFTPCSGFRAEAPRSSTCPVYCP